MDRKPLIERFVLQLAESLGGLLPTIAVLLPVFLIGRAYGWWPDLLIQISWN